jgi:hypothetical protein
MSFFLIPGAIVLFAMGAYYLFKAEDWAEKTVREKGLTGFEATNEKKTEEHRHMKEALRAFAVGAACLLLWFL